jgi:hypothetical protein
MNSPIKAQLLNFSHLKLSQKTKQTGLLLVMLGFTIFLMAQNKPKKMPLRDRIDLAMKQEFEMTKDPKLNFVPRYGLLEEAQKMKRAIQTRSAPPIVWNERGPDNVGGRTRAILVDKTNPNNVFAGSVGGGLWRLNNANTATPHWTQVNDFFNNLAVSCIAQNPITTTEMYFGTGEGFFNSYGLRGLGIWKSTNSGANWVQLASTNNNEDFYFVNKIVITKTGTLLAATGVGYAEGWSGNGGIMRSTDGGLTWTRTLSSSTHDLELAANGHIYAACTSVGMYKSTDDGQNWVLQTGGLPTVDFERIELATAPSNANVVYAIYDFGYNDQRIFKTIDGSTTWIAKTTPVVNGFETMASGQGWYDLIAAVDPNNPSRLYVGGIGIFMSDNSGDTWTHIGGHYTGSINQIHPDQHAIVFQEGSSSVIYFGNDGGIYRTSNGDVALPATKAINKGYNVTQYYAAALHPNPGSNYFLAGAQDNGTQKYQVWGVNTTTEATGGDGTYCHIDQDNPKIQITSYQNNEINVSKDSGATWSYIGGGGNRLFFINPTDYDDATNVLYGPYESGEFFYVTEIGTNNNFYSQTVTEFNNTKPTAVKVSPNVANRIYFALRDGQIIRIDDAHSSSRSITVMGKPVSGSGWVSSIEVKEGDENYMIMTFSNYGVESVWSSTDAGLNWINVEGNLPNMPIRCAIFAPDGSGKVLLGTELGVWMNDNALSAVGTIWSPINTGLPNVRVDMLLKRKSGNNSDKLVLAATHGRGVYSTNSFFSALPTFTCDVPQATGIKVNNIKGTTASLVWDFTSAATSYTVQYREAATTTSVRTSRIPSLSNVKQIRTNKGLQYAWTNGSASGRERGDGAGGNEATQGALTEEWSNKLNVTNNSAELSGLSLNTLYEFQISPVCGPSTPPPPANLSVAPINTFKTTGVPTCGKIATGLGVWRYAYPATTTMYWNYDPDVKGYNVEWRKAGTSDPWLSDFTPYNDYDRYNYSLDILPGTNYEFRVKTICLNDLESQPSEVFVFSSLPAACGTKLTITANTILSNAAYLSWNAAYTEGYVLAYRKVGDAAWLYRSFTNLTSMELDGLTPNTNYECKIKPTCEEGIDIYSDIITFKTPVASCENALVTGMNVTALTQTSATMAWNAVPNATSYNLTVIGLQDPYSVVVAGTSKTITIPADNFTWSIYDFRVTPNCQNTTVDYTQTTEAFTIGSNCPNALPALHSWKSIVTPTTARVHWGKSLNANQYMVRYRPATFGTGKWVEWIHAGTTTNSNQLYYDIVGLSPHTTYDYTVVACDTAEFYWHFIYHTVTTADAIHPCGVPTNLTATSVTGTSANFSWTAVVGASSYVLEYKLPTATTWTTVNLATNSHSLSGINPLTTYDIRIKSNCSATAIDGYVSTSITTLASSTTISLKAFLQGPYDVVTGKMKDNLRSLNLIPTTEPYTALGFIHKGGGGNETVNSSIFTLTGDNAIIDWVFIELRDATTPATVLYTRSALIQADGDIVDTDGVSPLSFTAPQGSYFIAIKHRNHLGMRTATAIPFTGSSQSLNFTDGTTLTFGTNTVKNLGNAKFGLWAGNVVQDNKLSYLGLNNDRLPIYNRIGASSLTATVTGYHVEDVNMDGIVKYLGSNNDRLIIYINLGAAGLTATLLGQF